MFTTAYHQPSDMQQQDKEIIKIIHPNVTIHEVPLEYIKYSDDKIEIFVDSWKPVKPRSDKMVRYKITFKGCAQINFLDIDYAYYTKRDYMDKHDGMIGYEHILKIENSKIIKELKKNVSNPHELDKLQHFAMHIQDDFVDIIAEDISVERVN